MWNVENLNLQEKIPDPGGRVAGGRDDNKPEVPKVKRAHRKEAMVYREKEKKYKEKMV